MNDRIILWQLVISMLVSLLGPMAALQASPYVNLVGAPDPIFGAHMVGIEGFLSKRFKLGVYGSEARNTQRPTYKLPNDDVENILFMRRAVSGYLSFGDIDKSGVLLGLSYGQEKSRFRSKVGSRADVDFQAYGLHAAYQFFWEIGFNIQLSATLAQYVAEDTAIEIAAEETTLVRDFISTNTKSNFHPGIGILFGWAL